MSVRTLLLIIGLGVITTLLLWMAFTTETQPTTPRHKITTISFTATPTPTPPKAALSFFPDSITTTASQSASFDVQLNSAGNTISSVQLEISYDPTVITRVQIGPPSKGKDLFSPTQEVTLKNIDTKNGEISFGFTIPKGSTQKQVGMIATITFVPLSRTQALSTLLFLPKTLVTQEGSSQSVLGDTLPATVLVKGPLPTPSTQPATSSAH